MAEVAQKLSKIARIDKLSTLIAYYTGLYYELDSPEISDTEYDMLVQELVTLENSSEPKKSITEHKGKNTRKSQPRTEDVDMLVESIKKKQLSPPRMVPCKFCGKDTAEGNEYCHVCVWKAKWPPHITMASENASRRKRSHLTKLIALDPYEPLAIFRGSKGNVYLTNIRECTCVDFGRGHGGRPCKHIYRLASELGLLTSETFSEDEDDYILHISEPDQQEIEMREMLQELKSRVLERLERTRQ